MYRDFKDYYSLLQIGFDASAAEIKSAYRKMAREYHPDMHPGETEAYTELFQEITEAYETLSDEEKKANYDFRYRQRVLGEGPQYAYYEDETPEDNTVYQHKYTARTKTKTSYVPILVLLLLASQLIRNIREAPPVYQPSEQNSTFAPENMRRIIDSLDRSRDTFFQPVSTPQQPFSR